MIKKLMLLGTVVAGAVLLQDRNRRERLMSSVKKFVDRGREALAESRGDRAHVPPQGDRMRSAHVRPVSPA